MHKPRWIIRSYNNKKFGNSMYERALKSLDDKLGEILNAIGKDTIIILTGDHGEVYKEKEGFFENYIIKKKPTRLTMFYLKWKSRFITFRARLLNKLGIKQTREKLGHGFHIYDSLLNVPLFISIPGKKHKVHDFICSHIDITPTILDLLGIQYTNIDGNSLLKGIKNDKLHDSIYCETTYRKQVGMLAGLRTEKYKYGYYVQTPDKEFLYSLETDPEEKINIAKNNPKLSAELKKKIDDITNNKVSNFNQGVKISSDEEEKIKKKLQALGYFD